MEYNYLVLNKEKHKHHEALRTSKETFFEYARKLALQGLAALTLSGSPAAAQALKIEFARGPCSASKVEMLVKGELKTMYMTAQHCINELERDLRWGLVKPFGPSYLFQYFKYDPSISKETEERQDGVAIIDPQNLPASRVQELQSAPPLVMPTEENAQYPTLGWEMKDAKYNRLNNFSEFLHYVTPGFSGGVLYRVARSPSGENTKIAEQVVLSLYDFDRQNTENLKLATDNATILRKKMLNMYELSTRKIITYEFFHGKNQSGQIIIENLTQSYTEGLREVTATS